MTDTVTVATGRSIGTVVFTDALRAGVVDSAVSGTVFCTVPLIATVALPRSSYRTSNTVALIGNSNASEVFLTGSARPVYLTVGAVAASSSDRTRSAWRYAIRSWVTAWARARIAAGPVRPRAVSIPAWARPKARSAFESHDRVRERTPFDTRSLTRSNARCAARSVLLTDSLSAIVIFRAIATAVADPLAARA
ncbi:MAG: hypothetical protein ABEJ94_03320 [Halorientalis sp.]